MNVIQVIPTVSHHRIARRLALVAAMLGVAMAAPCPANAQSSQPADQTTILERCSKILKYGDLVAVSEPSKVDAVHALGLLGDERAVPLLVDHLQNEPNDHLRMQIARSLGWLGSRAAVPALEKALTDKYPFVRQQAGIALKKITGREYDYDKTGLPSREKLRELLEKSR